MKKIFTFVSLLCAAVFTANAATYDITCESEFMAIDYYADYGDYQIFLFAEDGLYTSIDILPEEEESIVGSYSTDEGTMDLNYTYIYPADAKSEKDKLEADEAEATITKNGDTYTIKATILTTNGDTYNFTCVGVPQGIALDVVEDENTEVYFAATSDGDINSIDLYIDQLSEDGLSGTEFYTLFYTEGKTLTNGVYTINDSMEPGTVQTVYGMVGEYEYDELDQTYYLTNAFTICSGTITVDIKANGDATITVDAADFIGSKISYTYTGNTANWTDESEEEEGIENATLAKKVTKSIQNGQLVIENNGVLYNAQGAKF